MVAQRQSNKEAQAALASSSHVVPPVCWTAITCGRRLKRWSMLCVTLAELLETEKKT